LPKPKKSPTPIRPKRSNLPPSPSPEPSAVPEPSVAGRSPGPKILQVIAAATVGYALAVEGVGILLATESLEATLATVAELFMGRTVARLELVFEDEAKE
jgi:hypothetical protein